MIVVVILLVLFVVPIGAELWLLKWIKNNPEKARTIFSNMHQTFLKYKPYLETIWLGLGRAVFVWTYGFKYSWLTISYLCCFLGLMYFMYNYHVPFMVMLFFTGCIATGAQIFTTDITHKDGRVAELGQFMMLVVIMVSTWSFFVILYPFERDVRDMMLTLGGVIALISVGGSYFVVYVLAGGLIKLVNKYMSSKLGIKPRVDAA